MTIGFLFWLLFLLWFLFSGYWGWSRPPADRPGWLGGFGFALVLIFLLGWRVFGFPIQG